VSLAVMRALRPNPSERFASIEAFVLALHEVSVPRRSLWPWLLGLFVVIAGITWAVWPEDNALQPGPWRDAIAGTRVYEDVISGDWQNEDGILSSNEQISIVKLENDLPESYDVRMKFTRLSGEHSVALFFRANGTTGSAELDAWREGLAGVQLIDGEDLTKGYGFRFPLQNGRAYELLVEVRPNLVRMSVDGVFQKEFDLTGKILRTTAPWEWDSVARPVALGLGSYMSPTRFEKVEWRATSASR
jgi:hypothetical protein